MTIPIPRFRHTNIVLVDLLPASTRGFLQLSHPTGPAENGWEELSGSDVAPWRHSPADILRYYSATMDLVNTADRLLLAQPTSSGDEYVLLVDIDKADGEALLNTVERVSAGQYQGFSLQAILGTALLLAPAQRSHMGDRTQVQSRASHRRAPWYTLLIFMKARLPTTSTVSMSSSQSTLSMVCRDSTSR